MKSADILFNSREQLAAAEHKVKQADEDVYQALEALRDFAMREGQVGLVHTLDNAETRISFEEHELKERKKEEKEALVSFRAQVMQQANWRLDTFPVITTDWDENTNEAYGRHIHSNVEVIHKTVISFSQKPQEAGEIVRWLYEQGHGDDVTIKTRGNLDFYRERQRVGLLPGTIQIHEQPDVRVDGHAKWLVTRADVV